MGGQTYFAYHPLLWRLTLLAAALASLALTGWAALSWFQSGAMIEALRAVLSLGLLLATTSVVFRLRPRSGWGVRLGPTVLTVSRALSATARHIDIPWSAVREIRRLGRARDMLVLCLADERRVSVSRRLFPRHRDFEALVEAIEEKMPALPYDA